MSTYGSFSVLVAAGLCIASSLSATQGPGRLMVSPTSSAGDRFGEAVAASWTTEGNPRVLIGAPGDDFAGLDAGAVFVFERDRVEEGEWTFVARLNPAVLGAGFELGSLGVALDRDRAIAFSAFEVLVFERDAGGVENWGQVASLTRPTSGWGFPWSVELRGDVAVVSDFYSISVAVFRRDAALSSWTHEVDLLPIDPAFPGLPGLGLQLDGNELAFSSADDFSHPFYGAASVYRYEATLGWTPVAAINSSDPFSYLAGIQGVALSDGFLALPGSTGVDVFHRDQGGPDAWGLVDTIYDYPWEDSLTVRAAMSKGDLLLTDIYCADYGNVFSDTCAPRLYRAGPDGATGGQKVQFRGEVFGWRNAVVDEAPSTTVGAENLFVTKIGSSSDGGGVTAVPFPLHTGAQLRPGPRFKLAQ